MKPENPPAFPGVQAAVTIPTELAKDPRVQAIECRSNGMTLRDYFAAAALQGLLPANRYIAEEYSMAATAAYLMADEMLKVRNP